MNRADPLIWAAGQLRRRLLTTSRPDSRLGRSIIELLEYQSLLQRDWRRLQLALNRGWHLAAERLRPSLLDHIRNLQYRSSDLLANPPAAPTEPPTLRQLLEELLQLQRDFEELLVDRSSNTITVHTGPITLQDLDLGRFAIELHLSRLGSHAGSQCFDIVALDPNPAACNEDVTHPHVKEKQLCAGDGQAALSACLRQGRIADAFAIVHSILATYNPASPYVALDDWSGSRCSNCDRLEDRSDLHYCEHCQEDVCDDCNSCCDDCQESCCTSCLELDRQEDMNLCPSCRKRCSECDRIFRKTEDENLCPACQAEHQENDDEENQPQPPAQPLAPEAGLCPAGVAEAADVPAC